MRNVFAYRAVQLTGIEAVTQCEESQPDDFREARSSATRYCMHSDRRLPRTAAPPSLSRGNRRLDACGTLCFRMRGSPRQSVKRVDLFSFPSAS